MKGFMIGIGNFIFRWRDTIFTFVFLGAFAMIMQATPGLGGLQFDIWLSVVGFVLLVLGDAIRALATGYAWVRRSGLKKRIHAEELVRGGIFAHTRNPLYVGNLFIVTGAIATINLFWFHVIVLPLFFFIYMCIVLAEETYLKTQFGADYEKYLREVNRFWPGNLGDWKNSIADMEFDWKRVLKKEHGSTFVIFTSIVLFNLFKFHYRYGLEWQSPTALVFWALLAGLVVFQIIAEFLKRSGRLEWKSDQA